MAGFNSKESYCANLFQTHRFIMSLNAPFVVLKTHCLDQFNTHRFSKASHSVTKESI